MQEPRFLLLPRWTEVHRHRAAPGQLRRKAYRVEKVWIEQVLKEWDDAFGERLREAQRQAVVTPRSTAVGFLQCDRHDTHCYSYSIFSLE